MINYPEEVKKLGWLKQYFSKNIIFHILGIFTFILFLGYLSFVSSANTTKNGVKQTVTSSAGIFSHLISNYFTEDLSCVNSHLKIFDYAGIAKRQDKKRAADLAKQILTRHNKFTYIIYCDKNGKTWHSEPGNIIPANYNIDREAWFSKALKTSNPYIAKTTVGRQNSFALITPYYENNQLLNIIVTGYKHSFLSELLLEYGTDAQISFCIFDDTGDVIFNSEPSQENIADYPAVKKALAGNSGTEEFVFAPYKNERIIAAYSPLKELDLGIFAYQTTRTAYRPFRLQIVQMIILLFLFFILASIAAITLINISQRNRNLYEQTSKHADELNILYKISRVATESLKLSEVLNNSCNEIMELLGMDVVAIYLYEENIKRLALKSYCGRVKAASAGLIQSGTILEPTKGITGEAFTTGKLVVCDDLGTISSTPFAAGLKKEGFKTAMAIPIKGRLKIYGAMIVSIKITRPITPAEKEIIKVIGTIIGNAIDNINALEYDKELQKETRKNQQLKTDFISMISHGLRTPLNILKEEISHTLANPSGTMGQDIAQHLLSVRMELERLTHLANNLLSFSLLESGNIELKQRSLDINTLFKNAIALLNPYATVKKVAINTDIPENLPNAMADIDRIFQIVVNLIDNAIRFNRESGWVSIKVKQIEQKSLEIRITDTGQAFPDEETVKLMKEPIEQILDKQKGVRFELFAGKKGVRRLELVMNKLIIELHRGKFWTESTPEGNASFCFTLPIHLV
ncbi:MAG: GAF domain-containing protein [Planctomycetes bacterium]|nr:GAF domain-containing protein [Planctomycetota bacterium]